MYFFFLNYMISFVVIYSCRPSFLSICLYYFRSFIRPFFRSFDLYLCIAVFCYVVLSFCLFIWFSSLVMSSVRYCFS